MRFTNVKIRKIGTVTLVYTIETQLLMELKSCSTFVKLKLVQKVFEEKKGDDTFNVISKLSYSITK